MSVSTLHPEHLIDLLLAGEATAEQREQVHEHARSCSSCRVELALAEELAAPGLLGVAVSGTAESGTAESENAAAIAGALQELIAERTLRPDVIAALPSASERSAPQAADRVGLSSVAVRRARKVGVAVALLTFGAAAAYLGTTYFGTSWNKDVPVQKGSISLDAVSATAPEAPVTHGETDVPASGPSQGASKASAPQPRSPESAALPNAPAAGSSPSFTSTPDAGQQTAPLSAEALFEQATRARRAGQTSAAIDLYLRLQRLYPASSEARVSRLAAGRLLLANAPERALSQFDRYLKQGGGLQPEALVGRARALSRLGRKTEEQATWQKVIDVAPDSLYADQARRHLAPTSH